MSPEDATRLAATLDQFATELIAMEATRTDVQALLQREAKLRQDTEALQQKHARAAEEAATLRAQVLQVTTAQQGHALQDTETDCQEPKSPLYPMSLTRRPSTSSHTTMSV